MSSKQRRTGLTEAVRKWIQTRTQPFTTAILCETFGFFDAKTRQQMGSAVKEFVARGEILRLMEKRNRRQVVVSYRYNSAWKKSYATREGKQRQKVIKAMYVLGTFAVSDIVRHSEAMEQIYVGQIVRRLAKSGYLQRVGRRRCANSQSVEALWIVSDRDRFRLEVMG